ncbi:MAG: IS110 family transposase [Deltaproteobacteria bacterium]|nr:IS110 family transposase [Deltaproteobacteria bacterium]
MAAGIDVHRDTLAVTVRRSDGARERAETRTFDTFQDDIARMVAWFVECSVEVVALESTGVFWKPVVRELQLGCQAVVWLINPLQAKRVPGRKTDVSDSQWLSKLAMYGLVAPSFLPGPEQEELRKLTRHRVRVVQDRVRWVNRTIREMQAAGIKLDSVCSDPLGMSGRAMLEAIIEDNSSPAQIAELAKGRLRSKLPTIQRAVQGSFSEVSKMLLRQCLAQIDGMTELIGHIDAKIAQLSQPQLEQMRALDAIPGIDHVAAAAILAETGTDMSVFDSAKHLASWAGLSPGSNESAGKHKGARARKGDKYLRTILVQCATAASRAKGTFWKAKSGRLLRLGSKKAHVAIARKLLVCIYHMLRDGQPYLEPVAALPTAKQIERRTNAYKHQIELLGFKVTIEPAPAAPPPRALAERQLAALVS